MAKVDKTFRLNCSTEQAEQLAEAISIYAQTAYPQGGSECAQVARKALLESAKQIAEHAALPAGAQLRKRQRSMLKAAIRWYFSDEGPGNAADQAALLAHFNRET